jgi:hypothetical protein
LRAYRAQHAGAPGAHGFEPPPPSPPCRVWCHRLCRRRSPARVDSRQRRRCRLCPVSHRRRLPFRYIRGGRWRPTSRPLLRRRRAKMHIWPAEHTLSRAYHLTRTATLIFRSSK